MVFGLILPRAKTQCAPRYSIIFLYLVQSENLIPQNAFLYICLDYGLINPDHRRVLYEDSSATPTFPKPSDQRDRDHDLRLQS